VCCIDEFRDVPASEQSALLEAMEQQTISVAKVLICHESHPPPRYQTSCAGGILTSWQSCPYYSDFVGMPAVPAHAGSWPGILAVQLVADHPW
jgi:hypothetical protein